MAPRRSAFSSVRLAGSSVTLLASVGLVMTIAQPSLADPRDRLLDKGRQIAQRDCAACHAIGLRGSSPVTLAPPFRDLGLRYDVEDLGESLAEGISVGHPMMPERVYEPGRIKALLAYLRSLQPIRPHARAK